MLFSLEIQLTLSFIMQAISGDSEECVNTSNRKCAPATPPLPPEPHESLPLNSQNHPAVEVTPQIGYPPTLDHDR